MKNLLITGVIIMLTACSPSDKGTIYWVNSYKVDCVGVGPMKCLLIQKGETLAEGEWQNFYAQIEDFNYEPGFIYKLRVEEEKMENVPADASSIKYKLIELLEKTKDTRLALNGTWVAETIDGTGVQDKANAPRLEVQTANMEVMGEDGCNSFTGKIKKLTNKELVFAPLASTRKACPDMTLPDKFNKAMQQVRNYKMSGTNLILLNEQDKVLMVLKKTD